MKQWKCQVCGQVFEGDAPPVPCPVCSAGENAFIELSQGVDKWRCTVCGQVFDGATPPVPCPVCSAGEAAFVRESAQMDIASNDTLDLFVLVGGGVASLEAAKAIRMRNKTASIKLLCGEGVIPYNRPALSDVVADGLSFEFIALQEYSWYAENRIELICDAQCKKIDISRKTAVLSDGRELAYTKLLLATGAKPFVPVFQTDGSVPAVTLRVFADADMLYNTAKNKNIVVVGGGILGIEAALALRERNCTVSIVELGERLLALQADEYMSEHLLNALAKKNISSHTGVSINRINKGYAELTNGESIRADYILLCIGVRADISLALDAKLLTNRGIIINSNMQTSDADIYAAGDCAELEGKGFGLYSAAVSGGAAAGASMAGQAIKFVAPTAATAFEGAGITMLSCGVLGGARLATLVYTNIEKGIYQKLVYDGKVLVGAVLAGDVSQAASIIGAVSSKREYNLKM